MRVPYAVGLFGNFLALSLMMALIVYLISGDLGGALASFAGANLAGGAGMLSVWLSQRNHTER